jgi:hypothetical protein
MTSRDSSRQYITFLCLINSFLGVVVMTSQITPNALKFSYFYISRYSCSFRMISAWFPFLKVSKPREISSFASENVSFFDALPTVELSIRVSPGSLTYSFNFRFLLLGDRIFDFDRLIS